MMEILLAADGSPYTRKAAEYIATHFDLFQGEMTLHVLHVKLPVPAGLALQTAANILGDSAIAAYYEEEAQAALAPAKEIFRRHNISVTEHHQVGDIADEIQACVDKNNIAMVVMGSHGHGALLNALLGSVTTKVLAKSTVPVLIVR